VNPDREIPNRTLNLSLNQSERARAAKGLDTRTPRLTISIEMTWVHGDAATDSNANSPEKSVILFRELEIWSRIRLIRPCVV
jgi:hypothetical protein